MSIIIGKICGTVVKTLAAVTIGHGVTGVANAAIDATGLLVDAAPAVKTAVGIGTTVGGVVVGCKAVDAMVDIANSNSTPIVGKKVTFATVVPQTIEHNGHAVLVGTPTHKKEDKKIEVEIIGESPV